MADMKKALQKALASKEAFESVTPPQPGESDLEFCARKFDGRVFPCTGCGKEIQWIGACEACEEEFNAASMTDFDRIRQCGVPHPLAGCTWENFKIPAGPKAKPVADQIEALRTWKGEPRLAVLSGKPGTGKSHMAVATMWRRLRSKGPWKMQFIQERTLLERLKQSYNGDEESPLDRMVRLQFLVLDDFGQSRMTEWALDTAVGLICRRFDEGKVTLLTTNLTHADMAALDPRLGSRVYESLAVGTTPLVDYRKGKPSHEREQAN
jgi:DNA replication protein DnaC